MAFDHPGQNPPPPAVTDKRYSRRPPTRNRRRWPAYSPEPPRQKPRPGAPPLPHPPLLAGTRRRRLRLTAKHRHRQPEQPETACHRRGAPNPAARGGWRERQRREPLPTSTVSRAHHCASPWAAVPVAGRRRRPPGPPNAAPTVGHPWRPRPLPAAFFRCPRLRQPLPLADASKCSPRAGKGEGGWGRPQRVEGHAAARRGGGRCLLATPPTRSAEEGRRGSWDREGGGR